MHRRQNPDPIREATCRWVATATISDAIAAGVVDTTPDLEANLDSINAQADRWALLWLEDHGGTE